MKNRFIFLLLFLILMNCSSQKKFDFFYFSKEVELRIALLKETPLGTNLTDVEMFLHENKYFFYETKILRTDEDGSNNIKLIIVNEKFIKKIFNDRDYFQFLVINYKFDVNYKLSEIEIEGYQQ